MTMAKEKKKGKRRNIWNWMDGFRGDKVVLIIALLLMLISVISVFSSTPLRTSSAGAGSTAGWASGAIPCPSSCSSSWSST